MFSAGNAQAKQFLGHRYDKHELSLKKKGPMEETGACGTLPLWLLKVVINLSPSFYSAKNIAVDVMIGPLPANYCQNTK